jgi:hypothetical protein
VECILLLTCSPCILVKTQVNVMAYDYSGYGKSTGRPSEQNCYADVEAAFEYLTEQLGQSPGQIVL